MKHLGYGGKDMFVVVVYDVHQKRCAKVMKYFRQWLEHRQRSVFSGYLTTSQIKIMQHGLLNIIDPKYDAIIIFQANRANQITEWTTYGAERMRHTAIIANHLHAKDDGTSNRVQKRTRFRFSKR